MLRGRRHELAEIDRLFDGLHRGRPFVLTITGEPGSGRTALLDEARDRAGARGMRVLAARGAGGLAPAPAYDGLTTLLRPLVRGGSGRGLAVALGTAGPTGGGTVDPAALRAEVLEAITAAAEEQPMLLLLDDADGLDPSSADTLAFCLRRLGVDRIGALAASGAAGPFADVATDRLTLSPLADDDVAALVVERTGCQPTVAAAVAGWAGGNPLVAVELARSLTEAERAGTAPMPARPRAGVRVVEQLQRELDQLPEAARRALVVAAADRTGSVALVQQALHTLGADVDGLDAAEEAGVVVIDRHRLAFRHPLLRPLAYHLVAARSRRAAHRALAVGLVRPDQGAERVWQLESASTGPDEEVAAALELVADGEDRKGATSEAVDGYERAAARSTTTAARRRRLRKAAHRALAALALDDAVRLADAALHDGDGDGDDEAALLLLEAVERRDGPDVAVRHDALDAVDPAVAADLLVAAGRPEEARARLRATADEGAGGLVDAVRSALDPGRPLSPPPTGHGPLAERARRRWQRAAAARGQAPIDPVMFDELVAAAIAARVADRPADAVVLVGRAQALLPATAGRPARELDALARACEADLQAADPDLELLTPAERRVATAVADGMTNKEAAAALYLSVKTVDFHLQGIYRKLALRSRTELAVRLAGKVGAR